MKRRNSSSSSFNDDNKTIITISGSVPLTPTGKIRIEEVIDEAGKSHNKQLVDLNNLSNQFNKNNNNNSITIADVIGEFGYFQLSLTTLAFVKYLCLAMMTHTGSLIAPDVDFWCNISNLDDSTRELIVKTTTEYKTYDMLDHNFKNKCQLELSNGSTYYCTSWYFDHSKYGKTLTDSFNLVCEQDWYKSLYQSIVSVGVIMANIVWGSISDRYGRKLAVQICFLWSLLFGLVSCFVDNFFIYSFSRALCSFGDLGLVVSLVTIMVETLGNKYRGAMCIISYTGWAFGVMVMPWLTEYFMNYQTLMMFTVVCHLVTLPWLLITVQESARWSLVNGYIDEAKTELHRISAWSHFFKSDQERQLANREVDLKFNQLKQRFAILSEKKKLEKKLYEANWSKTKTICMSMFGGLSKLRELFSNKELIIVTFTMIWITFNCELLYMTTVLVNSDIGNNIKLNYAIGLVMECIATVVSVGMISIWPRKLSIISILLTTSLLCFVLAQTHHVESLSIWILNLDKLSVSTLTSVIYITTTELFPTNLRQTGFGLTATLGGLGSVVGPMLRGEVKKAIGMTGILYILAALPITAVLIIPPFLRETKGVELSDDVDDIASENFDYNLRRRTSSVSSTTRTNQQQPPVTTV